MRTVSPAEVASLPNESFDDIVYFGSDKATIEILNDKLAPGGIINIVLGGKRIGEPVSVGVGRVHYGGTRWIGTTGGDAAESYRNIPANGEIRAARSRAGRRRRRADGPDARDSRRLLGRSRA